MTENVEFPLWLIVVGGALIAWALLDRLFVPIIRWFFKRRLKIVIKEINECLNLRLPPFKLTRRKVLIDRLIYDTRVQEVIEEYCQEYGVSNELALKKVKHYAREIVPAFNAYIYFRFGNLVSKYFVRLLYRIRIGYADEQGLAKVNPNSSIVFVVNHRSNMDYILLGYLTLSRVALSFAVGEWARFFPVKHLIKAMGAYFVRRGSGNPLYRRVLARYVQMATEGGVVQAVFLEGGLSKDGKLREPKIGLLDYMLRNFDPDGKRDLVFIPAAVNYDRVFEDRSLLLGSDPEVLRKARKKAFKTTIAFILHNIWLMMKGGWYRFGYAAVNFGSPISMKEYMKTHNVDFHKLEKETRIKKVQHLAQELLYEIGRVIPVLPVSLIAYVFAENPDKAFSDLEIKAHVQSMIGELEKQGAHIYIPRSDRSYAITVGLRMLTLRHLVVEEDNLYHAAPEEIKVIHYYANAITHFMKIPGKI